MSSFVNLASQIRRKRDPLTWVLENFFIADGDHIKDDTLYTRTSKELLSNPQTKLAKKSGPVFVKTSERQIREDFTEEPTGIRTSEAEQMQLSIEKPLVLTEIANIIDDSNSEIIEREAKDETSLTIITPSIVTETPKITELTENPIERQLVLRKAVETPKKAKQQGQVEEQEVAVPRVVKEQLETEKDGLEQKSSLELAMQLAEEERLKLEARKSSKKEESDYWSKSSGSESYIEESDYWGESYIAESPKSIVMPKSAIQLQREEVARLKESLAKIDEANKEAEQAAERLEREKAAEELEAAEQLKLEEEALQLRLEREAEEREVRRKAELEKEAEERLAKIEEERENAAELEEAIAAAKLAVVRLEIARKNLGDKDQTPLVKTTLNSIETGKELLEIGERTQLLKLTEYLNALTKGMNVTAKSFEDPVNREHIKEQIKLRQEKEEAARLKAELEKQQAAKLLVQQSSEEAPSEEPSLSIWGRAKQFIFGSSTSENETSVELTTFVDQVPVFSSSSICYDKPAAYKAIIIGQSLDHHTDCE